MNTTAIGPELQGYVVEEQFRLLRWLGGSAAGGIYLTEVRGETPRRAAIKLIAANAPDAETRLAGWTAAAKLSHPHLNRVLQTGRCAMDSSKMVYAVTDFADEVLAEILVDRPLTLDETRTMLGPMLDALSYLHSCGFAHGRLKPSNILVVGDQLKLSGDCIALAGSEGRQLPERGIYAAPETSRGKISPAADVWSLGMIMVEALTQHTAAWQSAAGTDPVIPPAIPEPFAGVARRCLRLDPARRCTLGDIRAWLQLRPDPRFAAKNTGRRAALAAAGVVLVGLVAALVVHSRHAPQPAPAPQQPSAPAVAASSPSPSRAGRYARAARQGAENGGVVKRVQPDVLPEAQKSIRGTVAIKVRVTVDAGGNVSGAVSESPGASRYFTKVALDAARQWQFASSQAGGRSGPTVWILQFQFRQDGMDATAEPQAQ